LYEILQRYGVSQRLIAVMTEQAQSEISDILARKGRRVTSYDLLARIADGLRSLGAGWAWRTTTKRLGCTAAPSPASTWSGRTDPESTIDVYVSTDGREAVPTSGHARCPGECAWSNSLATEVVSW
jgi:hypothetical protein